MTEGTTGAPTAAVSPPPRPRRRSRRGLAVGLTAAVLAAGAGAGFALGAFDRGVPLAAPTQETVVLPSPTPTVAPVARTPLSPFADGLPASILDFALTALTEETPLLLAGALEGYRLTYSDGADGVVTVLAGQWPTPDEAATAFDELTAGATPVDDGEPATGEVLVGGAAAGTWTLTAAADGAGTLTWTNGTALLQAVAPLDVVRDVYAAFPL